MGYEAGKYKFAITSQGFTQAKTSSNPQFFLVGKVTGQINPDDSNEIWDCESYERTIKLTITDKTIDRVLSDLRKIGFAGSRFTELDPENPKCHSFVGQEIDVQCTLEAGQTNKDKLYERWELPYEAKPREAIKSEKTVASKLDALFGKKLSAANGGAKRPATRRATALAAPEGDDRDDNDPIPF